MSSNHFFHLAVAFRSTPRVGFARSVQSLKRERVVRAAGPAASQNLQKTSRSTSDVKNMLKKTKTGVRQAERNFCKLLLGGKVFANILF